MSLNRSFVGRRYPPTEPHRVQRQEISAFAAALGEADPTAAERGEPEFRHGPVAPPTFAITLSLRADEQLVRDPELRLDYGRVVHREQSFVHHRPIHAGDSLTVQVTVLDIRTIAGNDVLVTREEIVTSEGTPVCTATTTLVARGRSDRE